MPTHNGVYGRTHGQAYRAGEQKSSMPKDDMTTGADSKMEGGGKNIVAVKHSDGPPYHVKHEDGSVSKHDSHEDLMSHLASHIPSGMEEGEDQSMADADMTSGSKEAIDSMLG